MPKKVEGKVAKDQESTELYRMIWGIANDMRGSVDGWDFKQYVLGMLFYRFISENITTYINKLQQKTVPDFEYIELPLLLSGSQ